MSDLIRIEAEVSLYQIIRQGREDWLDPEDAEEMARELAAAGFRQVEGNE